MRGDVKIQLNMFTVGAAVLGYPKSKRLWFLFR